MPAAFVLNPSKKGIKGPVNSPVYNPSLPVTLFLKSAINTRDIDFLYSFRLYTFIYLRVEL